MAEFCVAKGAKSAFARDPWFCHFNPDPVVTPWSAANHKLAPVTPPGAVVVNVWSEPNESPAVFVDFNL